MADDLFRFSTTFEVRWRDLDAMGHVNNAVYFTYLEQTRVHYLRELGFVSSAPYPYTRLVARGHHDLRARIEQRRLTL